MFPFLLVPLPFIDEYTPLSNTKNDDTPKSHIDFNSISLFKILVFLSPTSILCITLYTFIHPIYLQLHNSPTFIKSPLSQENNSD